MSYSIDESSRVVMELIQSVPRAAILVPDDAAEAEVGEAVKTATGYTVFNADEIEESKLPFVTADRAVAVMAARYDGIDFNEDECRLLVLWGLSRAMSLQERFLSGRMAATLILQDRLLTRITQAAGRCTRTPTDYAAVVVLGYEFGRFLQQTENRSRLHPEIQAELEFGLTQSTGASDPRLFVEFLSHLLSRDKSWQDADAAIVGLRQRMTQLRVPAAEKLRGAVEHEVRFQRNFWNARYEEALGSALSVLTFLEGNELAGYRAFWRYLAASAATLAASRGNSQMSDVALGHYKQAVAALPSVSWLVDLSRAQKSDSATPDASEMLVHQQVANMEVAMLSLGRTSAKEIEVAFKKIATGIDQGKSPVFEEAHALLGKLLGFRSESIEKQEAAPDAVWSIGEEFCITFEDNTNVIATASHPMGANKVRQAKSHPDWAVHHGWVKEAASATPVFVSPRSTVSEGAAPHTGRIVYWNSVDFARWVTRVLPEIREAWSGLSGPGSLDWRASTAQLLKQHKLDGPSLLTGAGALPLSMLPVSGGKAATDEEY